MADSGRIEQIVFLQKDFSERKINDSVKQMCLDAMGNSQGKDIKALKRAIRDAVVLEEGYAFLTVKPDDFIVFLEGWFAFIDNLEVEDSTLKDIMGDELALNEAAD